MVYENSMYHFEYKIVFEKPGKYITLLFDQYMSNACSGNSDRNAEKDACQFEGRCPDSYFYICGTVQWDPHYYDFLDELIYLDKVVYRDKSRRIEKYR